MMTKLSFKLSSSSSWKYAVKTFPQGGVQHPKGALTLGHLMEDGGDMVLRLYLNELVEENQEHGGVGIVLRDRHDCLWGMINTQPKWKQREDEGTYCTGSCI